MRALDDDGLVLDAQFHVEPVGHHLTLVLASRSGAGGSRPARNPDYVPLLVVLLERLARLDAAIDRAEVDSQRTRDLSPDERRLRLPYPIRLRDEPSIDELRRRLTSAQGRVAQTGSKAGNNTKRMRLTLSVPGFGPDAAAGLAAELADPQHGPTTADDEERLTGFRVLPIEAAHTAQTTYDRSARAMVVIRAEGALVQAYLAWLGHDAVRRTRSVAGITDIVVDGEWGTEIIEAKSKAGHQHVRLALGQLLDYARSFPSPVERLTALLPSRPSEPDLDLLHTYGIDCLYQHGSEFERAETPAARRAAMRSVWSAAAIPHLPTSA